MASHRRPAALWNLEEALDSFAYFIGDCFRCPRTNVQIARVGEIVGPLGLTPLFACRFCVTHLLCMHDRAHETPGRRYAPVP